MLLICDVVVVIAVVVSCGLAKLGNIVAETMFLVMFPGVAKLGNICFGRKICVREAKNVFDSRQKHFFVSEQQNLFPQHMFPARLNWGTFASATMFPSLANLNHNRRAVVCLKLPKYENFTSFGRLHQKIAPKGGLHVLHDYFPSFHLSIKSLACGVVLAVPVVVSKLSIISRLRRPPLKRVS